MALQAISYFAAYEFFAENLKGTLTKGKLADFVILDKKSLKVSPMEIKNIQAVEAIKEVKTVFKNKITTIKRTKRSQLTI